MIYLKTLSDEFIQPIREDDSIVHYGRQLIDDILQVSKSPILMLFSGTIWRFRINGEQTCLGCFTQDILVHAKMGFSLYEHYDILPGSAIRIATRTILTGECPKISFQDIAAPSYPDILLYESCQTV